MRLKREEQQHLDWLRGERVPKVVEDYRGKYERVSALLDELPALLELVHRDVRRLSRSGRARRLLSQPGEPGPLLVAARPVERLDQRFAWGERIPVPH